MHDSESSWGNPNVSYKMLSNLRCGMRQRCLWLWCRQCASYDLIIIIVLCAAVHPAGPHRPKKNKQTNCKTPAACVDINCARATYTSINKMLVCVCDWAAEMHQCANNHSWNNIQFQCEIWSFDLCDQIKESREGGCGGGAQHTIYMHIPVAAKLKTIFRSMPSQTVSETTACLCLCVCLSLSRHFALLSNGEWYQIRRARQENGKSDAQRVEIWQNEIESVQLHNFHNGCSVFCRLIWFLFSNEKCPISSSWQFNFPTIFNANCDALFRLMCVFLPLMALWLLLLLSLYVCAVHWCTVTTIGHGMAHNAQSVQSRLISTHHFPN